MKRLIVLLSVLFFFVGCTPVQGVRVVRGIYTHVRDFFELKQTSELYNSETPDTEENKKSFTWHLGVPVSEDVKNIFAYAELWTDSIFLFSFSADTSTIEEIIKTKGFTIPDFPESPITKDLRWWDDEYIKTFPRYQLTNEKSSFILWYDEKSQQAYYQEFQY